MKLRNPINLWPTTHWSLVGQAGRGDAARKAKALALLIQQYEAVLKKHLLVVLRVDRDDVDDILQEFLLLKFLEKEIVQQADQNRGRFRNFLIVCINRFVQNRERGLRALKRNSGGVISLDENPEQSAETLRRTDSFDLDWARQVIGRAIRRVARECNRTNRPEIWAVFRERTLRPNLKNAFPVPYPDLVKKFHFASPAQASNVLVTANRMFARALHSVVASYEKNEKDIQQEILDLWDAVSFRGAGNT